MLVVIFTTLLAGLAMPLGALIASVEHIQSQWLEQELRHSIVAFGGGALLSAIALVLIPEGVEHLSMLQTVCCFLAGSLSFMALDIFLSRRKTQASQLAAMLSDFIPESIALGAAVASGNPTAYLLAMMIALQNLPEGFNAYREIIDSSPERGKLSLRAFFCMAWLGPVAGISGYLWLSHYPSIIGGIMVFAAGGILYSIFQDIAPQVKLERHYAPPIGATFGFLLGLIGFLMTAG